MNYRRKCLEANLELVNRGLISFTRGNASAIDRQVLRKHYERQHGPKAYYGQSSNNQ
jgi:hypothetical protein